MPPDRCSSQGTFDVTTLDPQILDAPDGLSAALHAIEAVCYRGDPDIGEVVATLNGRAYILEYIISGALRVTVDPCALRALINLLSSTGGGGIHEALEVDSHRVSHSRGAKYDGNHEYAAPPEVLILVVIRRVSIRRRYTPQPPRVLEKNRTLVRCPKGSRRNRQ